MSESSSYWYDSSPVLGTAAQIVWGGADVYCGETLVACKGTRLATMQVAILDRICELEGVTDMTSISIPCVLYQAWGTQDPTILNYIQYLLDNACDQKAVVDTLPTTNDPSVSIEYCCCSNIDGCGTTVTVSLSTHIQNIITCLCNLKEEVGVLKGEVETLYATKQSVADTNGRIDCLRAALINFNIANAGLEGFTGIDLSGCL
jgi:hypothetical protein